jgi:hypothetical protein
MTNRVAIKSCRSRIRPTLRSQIPVSKNPDQQLVKQCTGTREKSLIETSGSYAELQVWKATETQETMRTSWCLPATSVSARTPGNAFQRQYCPKIQEQIITGESNPNPQTTALNQLVSPSCLCEDATRHRISMPHAHSTKRSQLQLLGYRDSSVRRKAVSCRRAHTGRAPPYMNKYGWCSTGFQLLEFQTTYVSPSLCGLHAVMYYSHEAHTQTIRLHMIKTNSRFANSHQLASACNWGTAACIKMHLTSLLSCQSCLMT